MSAPLPPGFIFTDTIKNTPYRNLLAVLNGPIVAGVGASVDPGLARSEFHALPWDVSDRVLARIVEGGPEAPVKIAVDSRNKWREMSNDEVLKIAKFNVDHVFRFRDNISAAYSINKEDEVNLYKVMLCAMCIIVSMNYHHVETRVMNETELAAVAAIELTPLDHSVNYAKELLEAVVKGIYWVTHPVNEALLLPAVIRNTKIEAAYVPREGPAPQYLPSEEYFDILANTAPAGTHHFLVAAAAIKALKPLGLLALLALLPVCKKSKMDSLSSRLM
ncbi:hypothetical protein HI914_07103, partial [Erysiphe necator]